MTAQNDTIVADFDETARAMGEAVERRFSYGVRLTLRPQSGLLSASVEAQIARDLYQLHQGEDVLARYGFDPDEVGLLADPDVSMGFSMMIRAVAKGVALIERWNLVDKAGEPIPLNAESVRKFFHLGPVPGSGPVLMMEFQAVVDRPDQILDAEKNGSGSSSNGATAGEQSTVKAAGRSGTRARSEATSTARTARKSSTPRKPPRG